jgi:hypothetical protein
MRWHASPPSRRAWLGAIGLVLASSVSAWGQDAELLWSADTKG